MLLDSFSHVAEMLRPTDVIWLELQSLKVAEMLSPLMLQLELQNMKISYYYLQIYIIKYILFIIVLPPDASNFNIIPGHTFFGHEPSLDTYSFLDMNYHDIYYLDIDHCQTYIIMLNMNHKPQLDMDYWINPIVGHWTPN